MTKRLGIINPPYSFYDPLQQTNRQGGAGNGSKYDLFCRRLIEETDESIHLTPDGWMVNPKLSTYREFLISSGLKSISLVSRKIFKNAKLMGDIAIYHIVNGYSGDITINDSTNSFTITKNEIDHIGFIPQTNKHVFMGPKQLGFDQLYRKGRNKTTPLVGDRSKFYSDTLSPIQTDVARYKMISRLGGAEDKNEILWVDKPSNAVQYNKVCVTSASAERKLTYLQYVPKGIDVSEKIVYFPVDDYDHGMRMIRYLESDFVKNIVYQTKILSNNSKHMLSNIPLDMNAVAEEEFRTVDWMNWDTLTYGVADTDNRVTRRKVTSEVFTPDVVADFMVSHFTLNGEVFDPTCGDGQLLAAAARAGYTKLRGSDIEQENIDICKQRLDGQFEVANFLATNQKKLTVTL